MKWLIERLVQRLREQLIAQNMFEDSLGRWRLIQKSNGSCSALRRSLRLPLVVTVVVGTKGDNVARDYPTNVHLSPAEIGLPVGLLTPPRVTPHWDCASSHGRWQPSAHVRDVPFACQYARHGGQTMGTVAVEALDEAVSKGNTCRNTM